MIDWDSKVIAPLMGVFGEPVLYEGTGIPPGTTINGVFDEAYRSVFGAGDVVDANTTSPVLGIRAADLPRAPKQGDKVTVLRLKEQYTVRDPQPDSRGEVKLMLNFIRRTK